MNKKRSLLGNILLYLLIIAIVAGTLFPVWWIGSVSLKQRSDALELPPKFFFTPTLKNYREVLFGVDQSDYMLMVPDNRDFPRQVKNSVIVSFSATLLALVLGLPAAYAISKFRFKQKKAVSLFIISTRILPPIILVIPLFLAFRNLGLMDTKTGLVIIYSFISVSMVVWMMKGFFDEVPYELIESARVDGCGHFGAMLKIAIPVSVPGIAATAILVLISLWNEFLFAVIFTSRHARTVTMGVMSYITIREIAWSNMAAVGILITLPVLVFTIVMQKRLVQGLTAGAVKG
ncbi:MAG: carbohydrate ABC transporter permease [Treponema sp.]|jgi:multiple sugar transport system permease protein|nr:carbohydrate ABC transporter permease [Treponema sp.]